MNNEARYVLPRKTLYYFTDRICEYSERPVKTGILTGIIQDLDPKLHRKVLRSIVKAVYDAGDEAAAGRLSRTIVKGVDFVMGEEKRGAGVRTPVGKG